MRIGQNDQYFTQYTYLGAKSKNISEKDAVQSFSGDLYRESGEESSEKLGYSPLSQYTRASNSIMPQMGARTNIQEVGDELSVEDDDDFSNVANAKMDAMNNLLKKLGINGQVAEITIETVPQNYTMYYVETEGDAKNIAVLELKQGDFLFAETDQDSRSLSYSLGMARANLGMNDGKLSVGALEQAFAKFFDVDELKDLVWEFLGSKK